jgi:ketosteroid isomerase-like protein
MSEENVERARAGIAAYNRGDLTAMLATYDREVEFVTLLLGNHRGRDVLERLATENRESLSGYRYEIDELIDGGDTVIAVVHVRGSGRVSELELDNTIAFSLTFRDGLVIRQQTFRNKAEAIEATGLR